jgi:hypothetical protein
LRLFLTAAIASVAADDALADELILRGAGALWLAYGNPRLPDDLDFISLRLQLGTNSARRQEIQDRVSLALSQGLRQFIPDFDHWRGRLLQLIKIEVSACYMPCGTRRHPIPLGTRLSIGVADLEYLLAEKLIALARFSPGRKLRTNDPFDISFMMRRHATQIDLPKLAHYVNGRANLNPTAPIAVRQFTDATKSATAANYQTLAATLGHHFIPFNQAWSDTCTLLEKLPQPHAPTA